MARQRRPAKPAGLRPASVGIGVNRDDWAGLTNDPTRINRAQDWLRVVWLQDSSRESHGLIRMELTSDGELICTGLILGIHASTKNGSIQPITVRGLRQVPLQQLLWQLGTGESESDKAVREQWLELGTIGAHDRLKVRVGARGHPLEHYMRVAVDYERALTESPGAPVKRLAEMWRSPEGKPTPEPTIRRWLRTCREMDPPLLGPAVPGRPKMPQGPQGAKGKR